MDAVFLQDARDRVSIAWSAARRPGTLLERVTAVTLLVGLLAVGVAVVLAALVVAVPVGLALTAWWWVRARLPRARTDGRRNVRVRVAGVRGEA